MLIYTALYFSKLDITMLLTIICLYLSINLVLLITNLFRFYVLSSTHVALAILSLSCLTHLHFDLSWQTDLFVFIFCATVGTYNFIRHYASLDIKSRFNRPIFVFSFMSVLGMGLSATKLTSQTLLVALLLGMMSLTYVLPSNRFFRDYATCLSSRRLSAACWASVAVILPLLNHQIEFDQWLGLYGCKWMWTFTTIIPFEIRDISNDSESMKTIPQVFSVLGAKIIGTSMLFGVVVLSCFNFLDFYNVIPTLIACCFGIHLFMEINCSSKYLLCFVLGRGTSYGLVVDGCVLEMDLRINLLSRCLYFFSKPSIFINNDLFLELFCHCKNLSSKNANISAAFSATVATGTPLGTAKL